jgi:hypothetical protein
MNEILEHFETDLDTESINSILVAILTKKGAIESLEKEIINYNRDMTIHGYTPHDLRKMKRMTNCLKNLKHE